MNTTYNIRNLMALVLMLFSLTASAQTVEEKIGSFSYQLNKSTLKATVTGGSGITVNIPSTVTGSDGNTYTVTAIGTRAFCYLQAMTSLTIPSTVTSIGEEAFAYCTAITSLDINVATLAARAFKGCSSLTTLNVAVRSSLGAGAFQDCHALQNTTITALPSSTTFIRPCFQNCTGTLTVSVATWPTMTDESKHVLSGSCFGTINFNATKCLSYVAMNNPALRTININGYTDTNSNNTTALTTGCPSVQTINVVDGHSLFKSIDGVVYNKTGNVIVFFPEARNYFRVPENVTGLAQSIYNGQIPCVFDFRGCDKAPSIGNAKNVPYLSIVYRGSLFNSTPLNILTVENIYGDVNGDGDINVTDFNSVLRDIMLDQKH